MIDIAHAERRRRKTDDIDGWIRIVSRARSDYGFDPLKLGEKPENLARYREAELMHARWSMLGVAGAVAVGLLTGIFSREQLIDASTVDDNLIVFDDLSDTDRVMRAIDLL